MRLNDLHVQYLPGIDHPFSLQDFGPGLNVLVGPNGSGKSSVRRLVSRMLWPSMDPSRDDVRARASWETRQGIEQVDVGRVVTWQREGKNVSAPVVPDAHLASCYSLDLRDLLSMRTNVDQQLAVRLRIELSAGYDVRAVRQAAQVGGQAGRKEMKALNEARRSLAALNQEREQLAAQEDGLGALKRQRSEVRHRSQMKSVYTDAIAFVKTSAECRQVDARIKEFPSVMDRLQGQEFTHVDQFNRDILQETERLLQEEAKLARAELLAKDTRISSALVDPAGAQACQNRVRELRELELAMRHAQEQVARLAVKRDASQLALSAVGGEALTPPNRDVLSGIDHWLRRRAKLLNEKAELDAQIQLLERPDSPQTDPGILQKGMGLLRQWLAITNALESYRDASAMILGLLAGGLVALGLAFLVSPWFIALTGASFGALLGGWAMRRGLHGKRRGVQTGFDHLGVPAPGVWEDAAVQEKLEWLEAALTEANQRSRNMVIYETLMTERARLSEDLAESEDQRAALIEDAGFDPSSGDLLISELAHRLVEARAFSADYDAAVAGLADFQKQAQKLLEAINRFVSAYGADLVDDVAAAEAVLDDIKARTAKFERATQDITHSRENIGQMQQRIRKLEETMAALFEGLALGDEPPVVARGHVHKLCAQLPAYKQAIEVRQRLRGRLSGLEAQLAGHEPLTTRDLASLQSLLDDAVAADAELEEIEGRIANISARVNIERTSTRFEESVGAVDQAQSTLANAYEGIVDATLKNVLLDCVEEKHEQGTQPEVFAAASGYFSKFTQGQYDIILREEEGETTFAARDAAGRGMSLEALSDGTRIQLLLAARLAFASGEERDERLPIWLDEALTTSDQMRFVAIIDALAALVEEGRQVFYLTSNPLEARLIESICADHPTADAHIIDLALARQLARAESILVDPDQLRASRVPAPDGMGALAYAQALKVPPLRLTDTLEDVHLYHVLFDDLQCLYMLLLGHVATIGQWRALHGKGQTAVLLDSSSSAALNARVDALQIFLKSIQEGRGKPVDERVLRESGAVSDTYLDRLTDIANDHDHDAHKIMACLDARNDDRSKGFRQDKLEALRDFFELRGYMDARKLLASDEISARVLNSSPVRAAISRGALGRDDVLHAIDVWSEQLLSQRAPLSGVN